MKTLVAQRDVPSVWEIEKGRWCEESGAFVDLSVRYEERDLTMQIIQDGQRYLIHFSGGPTGCETYDWTAFDRKLPGPPSESLCICAGTINRWPKCSVPMQAVTEALEIIREVRG